MGSNALFKSPISFAVVSAFQMAKGLGIFLALTGISTAMADTVYDIKPKDLTFEKMYILFNLYPSYEYGKTISVDPFVTLQVDGQSVVEPTVVGDGLSFLVPPRTIPGVGGVLGIQNGLGNTAGATFKVTISSASPNTYCVADSITVANGGSGTFTFSGGQNIACYNNTDSAAEITLLAIEITIPGPSPSPTPSPTPTSPPSGSITLSNLIVSQALDNFSMDPSGSLDLVAGKDTAIQVSVKSTPSNIGQSIIVKATMDDGTSTSKTVDASSVSSGVVVTLPNFYPKSAGQSKLVVTAISDSGVSGVLPSKDIFVHATNSFKLSFVPIDGCTGGTKCFDAFDRAGMSNGLDALTQFTIDTYPIPTSGGLSSIISSSILGTPHTDPLAVVEDLMTLSLISKRTNVDRVVGLVSPTYLSYHHQDFGGVANPNLPGSVILSSRTPLNGLAHELGHTFGLADQYDSDKNYIGVSVTDGFNVRTGMPLGTSQNFMGPAPIGSVWVSDETFGALIKKLSSPLIDPAILIVSGLVSSNGAVSLRQIYNSPVGTLSSSTPGTFTINTLDSDGQITSSTSLSPSYYTNFDQPDDGGETGREYGHLPSSQAPFVVALANTGDVASVQFVSDGKVVSTVDPRGNSLVDVINAIPKTSYNRFPNIESRILLAQAKIIQKLLAACAKIPSDRKLDNFEKIACTDGAENLVLILRDEMSKSLNDSPVKTDPLQMTRDEALRSVDFTALSLLGSPRVQSVGKSFTIRVVPTLGKGELKIDSFTQGQSGSVNANPNGTLTYTPNGKKTQSDSFKVVVKSVEGDSVSKTVNIVGPFGTAAKIQRWEKRFN